MPFLLSEFYTLTLREENSDWELRTTGAKDILEGLSGRWVQLYRTEFPISLARELIIIDGSCLHTYLACNVLRG